MEILAFIPPILIGSAIVVILFPDYSLKGACCVFTVCLGAGIGLGLTSSTIFLWLRFRGGQRNCSDHYCLLSLSLF